MATVKPKDLKDLDAAELYRSAIEDFALPIEADEKNKKKVLLAAFVEGGVSWDDYVEQHPEAGPSEEELAEAALVAQATKGVVTSQSPKVGLKVEEEVPFESPDQQKWATPPVVEVEPRIVVKESVPVNPSDKFLIKMTRKNPLFEVRGYRFTSSHPYALVDAVDAQYILEVEDGFRQAYPNELAEFYG